MAANLLDTLLTVAGLCDENDVRVIGDQCRDTGPQERMIINHEQSNRVLAGPGP
jgi:hypothetical protein